MSVPDQPSARDAASLVVRLQLLGPVAAWRGDLAVDLGPPLQRAVLCLLAAQPGQVVAKDRLIAGLWGGGHPKTAEQSVYTYIAGLRGALEPEAGRRGPYGLVLSSARGYLLAAGAYDIDAGRFDHHLGRARHHAAENDPQARLGELEAALRQWTGPALGGVPGPFAHAERERLEGLRLTAREDQADTLLCLGRPQEAVELLTALVGDDPLRERARELLMLALYRCGRQAEALAAYHEGRRLLAEHLGVDPGESLQRCHELILRADPSLAPPRDTVRPPTIPRQLPRDIRVFVGRAEELARLRSLLVPPDGSAPQAIVAVTGTAGAGKSAVAVHAAHAVRDHFPGGQLYANLLGATPGVQRLRPIDLLGRLLRGLGVHPEAVPAEPDEAAAMLRTRLQGRRLLIVLDDAAGPDQVRPLLGLPAGNAVLVTSRESFAIVDDCVAVPLGTMPHAEAVAMLAELVGAERVAADPRAAAELANLCGGLPLALRLAAARLAENRHASLKDLNARLRDRRRALHELESGDVAVSASLRLSHDLLSGSPRELDVAAARALRHLGVLHIPDATAEVVAALLDVPAPDAERYVDRLARAHLAERHESGRFRLHDLVRLFAIELAERHLTDEERRDALLRAVGLYGLTIRHAMTLVDANRVHPPYDFVEREPVAFAEEADAFGWLERERPNILAAAAQAMSVADPSVARAGAYLTFTFYWPLV
ncbi:hypothetical protein GCM10009530_03200 [Microbispora corallina]|uniref:OmpR/PhoB-type domain-containing protein n=1 Tax=Microbispora corallina TaxID=83302 RepID=A0ABQ4FRL9_9ACTN|nr:AfsR/SARP family transcriptional regulator [Microbispora corallina]GIH37453.1 hypothetical protein Mco01_04530 [Microbispora corallina]